jgi:hypothetical protein
MLAAHTAYWACRSFGVDIWLIYAHSFNVLIVAQLVFVAIPGCAALIARRLSQSGERPMLLNDH